ncbi:MAG: hypothetical protein U9Q82_04385 [Chloroflexota bacterium]|nr:hypothetical protein [Chloroflexota bacterium]
MKDKETMLDLMRFWLFGTFVILIVAATVYTGGVLGLGMLIFKELFYWLALVISAVLCVLWYFVYKWYLDKKM